MKKKPILSQGRVRAAISAYDAGERQAPHRDSFSRISFVLNGGYREEHASGVLTMRTGDILLKSRSAAHDDVFGGVTLASLEFVVDDPFEGADVWRRRNDARALLLAAALLEAALAGDAQATELAGRDLAVGPDDAARRSSRAPRWLHLLRDSLDHQPLSKISMIEQGAAAGVHPAHVSRLFRRCYGQSITEYAQSAAVRRALGRLAAGDAISEAALDCGFYDQSHMNRVFRRVTARTPGDWRRLYAAARG